MLEEAIDVIRRLWTGDEVDHRGRYFTVENARVYTRPTQPPPILMAAGGAAAAKTAGERCDGLIATSPDARLVEAFRAGDGAPNGPRLGQVTVSWAASEAEARKTALRWWPNAAIHGAASQELARPADFEDLVKDVTEDQIADVIVCGPDPARYHEAIDAYAHAGFDHVYLHQVGTDQGGFLDFARRHLL
jgi:G6PDH family F420-dependent oxidoreductase